MTLELNQHVDGKNAALLSQWTVWFGRVLQAPNKSSRFFSESKLGSDCGSWLGNLGPW